MNYRFQGDRYSHSADVFQKKRNKAFIANVGCFLPTKRKFSSFHFPFDFPVLKFSRHELPKTGKCCAAIFFLFQSEILLNCSDFFPGIFSSKTNNQGKQKQSLCGGGLHMWWMKRVFSICESLGAIHYISRDRNLNIRVYYRVVTRHTSFKKRRGLFVYSLRRVAQHSDQDYDFRRDVYCKLSPLFVSSFKRTFHLLCGWQWLLNQCARHDTLAKGKWMRLFFQNEVFAFLHQTDGDALGRGETVRHTNGDAYSENKLQHLICARL